MSAPARKPPTGGRETPTATPTRPARASTPTSGAAAAPGPARTRSSLSRTGTPVSARAAMQRRESLLGPSTGAGGEGDETARAETVAMLDDLKERLAKAESASDSYKKQSEVLQSRLDEAHAEQAKLEEKVHEGEEQNEFLINEKRDAIKKIREMESIYEAERSSMTREKEDWGNREEEMQAVIQRLKDSLSSRNNDDEGRPTRQSVTNSPSVENGSFAPPSSIQRSDSRNNSKLLLQKDKLIESLRLELAEAQIKLVESENQGGGRLHEVERQLMEARMANARLMEDNESYQLLLQERTLKGDFGTGDFNYMGASANHDALAALEGRGGASLADELSEATDGGETETESSDKDPRRLEAELKAAKDQNKALTLYINKIIERLLQHQDFEHILDQSTDFKAADTNKALPPPPAASGQSLLQRAKSIAVGGAPAKARPRPMSFMPSANSAHNNPETAPSIPIGLTRNTSTRRPAGRPMSEQFTGGAANVVNQMYKGGSDGPLSPSLRNSQTFFLPQGAGNRASSGGPGSAAGTTGNFPGMRSETSSTSGDSGGITTPPSGMSPPRAHAHEKSTTFAGNKPRPLRLVQENPEMAGQANKRQSWMGWAQSAFAKKEESGGPTSGDTIKE